MSTSPGDIAYLSGFADGAEVSSNYVRRLEFEVRVWRGMILAILLILLMAAIRKAEAHA